MITLEQLKLVAAGEYGLQDDPLVRGHDRKPRVVVDVDAKNRLVKYEDGSIESVWRRRQRELLVLVRNGRRVRPVDLARERDAVGRRNAEEHERKEREKEAEMTPVDRFVREVRWAAGRHGLTVDEAKIREAVAGGRTLMNGGTS